jgi:hypothetical protein
MINKIKPIFSKADVDEMIDRLTEAPDRIKVTFYISLSIYKNFQKACDKVSASKVIEEVMKQFIAHKIRNPGEDKTELKTHKPDPNVKLASNLRSRINSALKAKNARKNTKTLALVGCSVAELHAHLQSKFTSAMTWDNYGPYWHVDHIRPLASFDLTCPRQQEIAFHYSNLQPLEASENLRKSAKWSA